MEIEYWLPLHIYGTYIEKKKTATTCPQRKRKERTKRMEIAVNETKKYCTQRTSKKKKKTSEREKKMRK